MKLSIVAVLPAELSAPRALFDRLSRAASALGLAWEMVWVSDGAPGGVPSDVLELCRREPALRVVDLSRPFGRAKALLTGLAHTDGDLVWLADGALAEPPEALGALWHTLQERGADVVHGVQGARPSLGRALLRLLLGHPVPDPSMTLCLMTRRFADALLRHREQEVFLPGLMATAGFVQASCPVERAALPRPESSGGMGFRGLVDAVTAFSNRPLTVIFYLGCGISLLAACAAAYLVIRWLAFGGFLEGWASLMVSIWLLGGLTIFCLGLLGIYLAKIFTETKRRPYTVVRAVHQRPGETADG